MFEKKAVAAWLESIVSYVQRGCGHAHRASVTSTDASIGTWT
jgi:hypothetical protein